jgi:hypothetical protein
MYVQEYKTKNTQHLFVKETPTWAVWVKIGIDTNIWRPWSYISRLLTFTGTCLQQVRFGGCLRYVSVECVY